MGKVKSWMAAHLIHLGWAVWGQDCNCGYDRFNWLARIMMHVDSRFQRSRKVEDTTLWRVGCFFYDLGTKLDPELEGM